MHTYMYHPPSTARAQLALCYECGIQKATVVVPCLVCNTDEVGDRWISRDAVPRRHFYPIATTLDEWVKVQCNNEYIQGHDQVVIWMFCSEEVASPKSSWCLVM